MVRLGGIYALEGVMKASLEYHQSVLEALCAFVRERTKEEPQDNPPADVQAALTVIGRRMSGPGQVLLVGASISGAILTDANLTDALVGGVDLRGALLLGAKLRGSHLKNANLSDANLGAADLTSAELVGYSIDWHRFDLRQP